MLGGGARGARGRIEVMSMSLEECEKICSPGDDGMLKLVKGFALEGPKDEADGLGKLMRASIWKVMSSRMIFCSTSGWRMRISRAIWMGREDRRGLREGRLMLQLLI